MNRSMSKPTLLAVVAATALLALATAATATAHRGGGKVGPGGAGASALVTDAAKRLNVTRARLVDAIQDSARTRIDAAVEDGDLARADAADLKEEVGDNLHAAIAFSTTRTVAANLGVTTTRLNDAFRVARRAAILARIEEALDDDRIDEDRANELEEELEDAELPGYKGFGFGGRGFGFGGPRGR